MFGGSFGSGGAALATGGSAGFQFTRYAGLELEVSVTPDMKLGEYPDCNTPLTRCVMPLALLYPAGYPFPISSRARAVNFVANYVVEFPTAVRWLRPYVEGGGGVSSVTTRVEMAYPGPVVFTSITPLSGVGPTLSELLTTTIVRSVGTTDIALALSTGGGVDFLVARHVGVGADVRYMHLFGQTDWKITRVGTRVSIRF